MKFSLRTNIFLIALVLAGATTMVSCSKFDDDETDIPVAGLMAFNLAPDQASLQITLDGTALTNYPLPYTNYTGGYLAVFPGSRMVEAYGQEGVAMPLASATGNFQADRYYSSFTIGADDHYRNLIVEDELDTLAATGEAYVRYINAIPDSSRPDVRISAGGTDALSGPAAFGSISSFTAITPGEVKITVSDGAAISAQRTISLEQNKIYTVLLTGLPGTTPAGEMIKFMQNGTVSEDQAADGNSARSSLR